MSIALATIINAIRDKLTQTEGLVKAEALDSLTNGVGDTPMLKIWVASGDTDPGSNTGQSTFRGGVRQTSITIYADLFARPRSNLADDMVASTTMIDAIINILESESERTLFGLNGIKSFTFGWEWLPLQLGEKLYSGARFTIVLRTF